MRKRPLCTLPLDSNCPLCALLLVRKRPLCSLPLDSNCPLCALLLERNQPLRAPQMERKRPLRALLLERIRADRHELEDLKGRRRGAAARVQAAVRLKRAAIGVVRHEL